MNPLHHLAAWLWEQRAEARRDHTPWLRGLNREGGWIG